MQEVFNRETRQPPTKSSPRQDAGGPEASGIVCARLVATTEEEALAALVRIEGGEAFGDVATELLSTNPRPWPAVCSPTRAPGWSA